MRGKHGRRADTRRDREALVAEAEAANLRADKAEAELAAARAEFEHRLTAATNAAEAAKRLMEEQSSPELRKARETIEGQRTEVAAARDKLKKWDKYRKRFEVVVAKVLVRNFDIAYRDAKALIGEAWITTAADNEEDALELYRWLAEDIPSSPAARAIEKGRLTPAQQEAHGAATGRINPRVRPKGGDFDETWGRQWTNLEVDAVFDDEDDESG